MKITVAVIFYILISPFVFGQSLTGRTTSDFNELSWLEGKWSRLYIKKPGRTSFEVWVKLNEQEYIGKGIVLQGIDTVSVEKLKIIIQDNEIHYVADVPENPKPVHFKFTAQSVHGFTCENPKHDFPKKISYQIEGNTMTAQISGDGKKQEFIFEKSIK